MGSTSRSTWKAFERKVAKFFGSCRTPLSGSSSRHTCSDSLHPSLFIECKLRNRFAHHEVYPLPLATKEGKIPILVTQKKYQESFLITIDKDYLMEFCRKFLEGRGYRITKPVSIPEARKVALDVLSKSNKKRTKD